MTLHAKIAISDFQWYLKKLIYNDQEEDIFIIPYLQLLFGLVVVGNLKMEFKTYLVFNLYRNWKHLIALLKTLIILKSILLQPPHFLDIYYNTYIFF